MKLSHFLYQQQEAEEDRREISKRIIDSTEPEVRVSCPSSPSAACAAAAAKVSLSESETEDDALTAIADAFVVPQWDDNSLVTELSNTLTALTLARAQIHDPPIEDVVVSLRRIVTVTNSPAEAEVDFSMIPWNPLRPRALRFPLEQMRVLHVKLCYRTRDFPD